MKKMLATVFALVSILAFAGCGNAPITTQSASSEKPAVTETSSVNGQKSAQKASNISKAEVYATRKIEGGTPITLTIGNTVIPATLNDGKASKDLLSRLPYTVKLRHFTHDYCGVMKEPLSYDEKDVHNGWMNGDIDFATDGNYFTILCSPLVLFYNTYSNSYGGYVKLGYIEDISGLKEALGKENVQVTFEVSN